MKARLLHNDFPCKKRTRFTHCLTGKKTAWEDSIEDLFFVCMSDAENAFISHGWEAGKEYTPHDIVIAASAMFEKVYTNQDITLGYPENNYKEREKGEIKEVDI
jgi:hypothetical protein